MSETTDFYQIHLDRVSRSFAFCIAQLKSPLREWVGLSYLLCRVVDTIEDAAWAEAADQTLAFGRFDAALRSVRAIDDVRGLDRRLPADVTPDERSLLEQAPRLMTDFHALPPRVRVGLEGLIQAMSRGMQHFATDRPLVLSSLREVNQYCFFVAGVVGEMLARLLAEVEPSFEVTPAVLLNAHHFGQFLQKVNVLKDQIDDESKGRRLVPGREILERSVAKNARHALAFLLSVPAEQREFRRFCAWSLFMGLESLLVARASVAAHRVLSIPRERNVELLGRVEECLGNDDLVRDLFAEYAPITGAADVKLEVEDVPDWFRSIYRGPLGAESLRDLGL